MMSVEYGDRVLEHFTNPRNVGEIKDADGVGTIGNPACGDILRIYIKVKDDIIEDVKFKTFGCAAAIASGSVLTEMVKGRTIKEALAVSRDDIIKELGGGLPSQKRHCSVLAQNALKKAVLDYNRRRFGAIKVEFQFAHKATVSGELYRTSLGSKIIERLPIEAEISLWGKEAYFKVGLQSEISQPQVRMDAGDIAYWPDEGSLCLFWGPTPIGTANEILAYSPVEVVGSFKIDEELLDSLKEGDTVRLTTLP